jgi:DNA-binding FrmR family transcriptional regulator
MLSSKQQEMIVARLNRVEGQVRGISRMVQEPRLCVDILQQVAAAEAALNRISLELLKHHIQECVPQGVEQGGAGNGQLLADLRDVFNRFAK